MRRCGRIYEMMLLEVKWGGAIPRTAGSRIVARNVAARAEGMIDTGHNLDSSRKIMNTRGSNTNIRRTIGRGIRASRKGLMAQEQNRAPYMHGMTHVLSHVSRYGNLREGGEEGLLDGAGAIIKGFAGFADDVPIMYKAYRDNVPKEPVASRRRRLMMSSSVGRAKFWEGAIIGAALNAYRGKKKQNLHEVGSGVIGRIEGTVARTAKKLSKIKPNRPFNPGSNLMSQHAGVTSAGLGPAVDFQKPRSMRSWN